MATVSINQSASNAGKEAALYKIVAALNDILFTSAAVDLASIAAGGVGSGTLTLTGAETDDAVWVAAKSLEDGLVIESAAVTSADTVTVRVLNTTAGAIDPASTTFYALVVKKDTLKFKQSAETP